MNNASVFKPTSLQSAEYISVNLLRATQHLSRVMKPTFARIFRYFGPRI